MTGRRRRCGSTRGEADRLALLVGAQVGEGAGGDEQDVLGVDHDEVVFVPVLGHVQRDEQLAPLEDLQQRLLHPFAADVAPGAGAGARAAAGDLVDLVDEHDAPLGALDVLVGPVEQFAHHDLHVFAVIARLGVFGGVGDGEGHLEQLGQGARDVGLARAGGPHHQDVGLAQEALAVRGGLPAPLEVVVGSDGHRALGPLLPDHVAVEVVVDLPRRGERLLAGARVDPHRDYHRTIGAIPLDA